MKIALFGKIRSGKDTVGKILIKEHGFKRFAFGDGIGRIIEEYFPEAFADGKPRKYYQFIGQQLRVLNPDVWVNYLLSEVNQAETYNWDVHGNGLNIVVTDGRQLNEAERLKKEGYLIIKVICPEDIRIKRMEALGDVYSPEDLQHETELQVDAITPDVEILNDGTLMDLYVKIQKLVQDYREGKFNG